MFGAEPKSQPIEVWLTQHNLEVRCTVVYEDERTDEMGIDSLSMRGAQREVTGWMIKQGYVPVGRWEAEGYREGNVEAETSRRFKPDRESDELTPSEEHLPRDHAGVFYVYENWTNTFVKIHAASCPFCKDGQGAQGRGSKTGNGQWIGPFPTLGEALDAGKKAADGHSNRPAWSVAPCSICRGEMGL